MKLKILGAITVSALGLAACGSSPTYDNGSSYSGNSYSGNSYASNAYTEYGRVTYIEQVGGDGRTTGAGAVLGGVVGGVLGHQVGSGRGNTAATIGGAVAGAAIGNEVERRRDDGAFRVDVRLENGDMRSATLENVGDLRVGDRVRVAEGRISRY
jgi:outer membrane lipoprotein SlyB